MSWQRKAVAPPLLRYAVRLLGAWMADSGAASTSALRFVVAPVCAFVETGLIGVVATAAAASASPFAAAA
jgi:hypothetical protein